MSKKKFTSGLDNLFAVPDEAPLHADGQTEIAVDIARDGSVTVANVRRTGSKNFTSDLDSLFQEALTEVVEEKVQRIKRDLADDDTDLFGGRIRQSARRPLSGLDALIRETVDTSLAGLDLAPVKRITFAFENQKLEKLKSIAKRERAYVKDIIQGVISEFIEDYERKKGVIPR
jgi:hypothetical protein